MYYVKYDCPNCGEELIALAPYNKGEVWDSTTICKHCEALHFVVKTCDHATATLLQNKEV